MRQAHMWAETATQLAVNQETERHSQRRTEGATEPLTTRLLFGEQSFLWLVGKTSSQEATKPHSASSNSSSNSNSSPDSMPRCTRVPSK
ncbi:hypothetical protein ACLKA7_015103 [Drosophila subpalustris]